MNQENDEKQINVRNTSFEILRIVAILFIIASHFALHGQFDFSQYSGSRLIIFNSVWIDLLSQLGKIGVNLFMLISAYFLCKKNNFKLRKLLSILIEMLFFSLLYGIIRQAVTNDPVTFDSVVVMLFPFGTNLWWFMTTYLILYIFSPFINRALNHTNKTFHLILVIILLFMWSFGTTFLKLNYEYSYVGWFFVLYMMGSYISKYDISMKTKPIISILIAIAIFAVFFAIRTTMILCIEEKSDFVNYMITVWFDMTTYMHNAFQVVATTILFLGFKDLKVKTNKVVNFISGSTLTRYLFHDHYFMWTYLWVNILHVNYYQDSIWLAPYSIGITFLVALAGLVVYIAYRYSIGLGVDTILMKCHKKWFYKVDNIFNNEEA